MDESYDKTKFLDAPVPVFKSKKIMQGPADELYKVAFLGSLEKITLSDYTSQLQERKKKLNSDLDAGFIQIGTYSSLLAAINDKHVLIANNLASIRENDLKKKALIDEKRRFDLEHKKLIDLSIKKEAKLAKEHHVKAGTKKYGEALALSTTAMIPLKSRTIKAQKMQAQSSSSSSLAASLVASAASVSRNKIETEASKIKIGAETNIISPPLALKPPVLKPKTRPLATELKNAAAKKESKRPFKRPKTEPLTEPKAIELKANKLKATEPKADAPKIRHFTQDPNMRSLLYDYATDCDELKLRDYAQLKNKQCYLLSFIIQNIQEFYNLMKTINGFKEITIIIITADNRRSRRSGTVLYKQYNPYKFFNIDESLYDTKFSIDNPRMTIVLDRTGIKMTDPLNNSKNWSIKDILSININQINSFYIGFLKDTKVPQIITALFNNAGTDDGIDYYKLRPYVLDLVQVLPANLLYYCNSSKYYAVKNLMYVKAKFSYSGPDGIKEVNKTETIKSYNDFINLRHWFDSGLTEYDEKFGFYVRYKRTDKCTKVKDLKLPEVMPSGLDQWLLHSITSTDFVFIHMDSAVPTESASAGIGLDTFERTSYMGWPLAPPIPPPRPEWS